MVSDAGDLTQRSYSFGKSELVWADDYGVEAIPEEQQLFRFQMLFQVS